MSLFDSIKEYLKIDRSNKPINIGNLTYADKELIMVQRVSMKDMQKFTNFPFGWDTKIRKSITCHSHPFAYMNLSKRNIRVAELELQKLNKVVTYSHKLSRTVPSGLSIPVNDVVFNPSCKYGYSKIKCSPYTIDGCVSQYPASLFFTTDQSFKSSTTHGEIFYDWNGEFGKAEIYFWRNGIGYFFHFNTVNSVFTLSTVETASSSSPYTPPTTVYKGKHILWMEAMRKKEVADYAWLQKHIPEKCPKSLAGFRKMKTQGTKNYHILRIMAADLGREI